jgi:carboxypeptidase family protein
MLCLVASTAAGQAGGRLVATVVERESSTPLAYSTVTLTAADRPDSVSRFTDDAGQTLFVGLSPGRYRVRARELGFAPADSVIEIADTAARRAVVFRLRAIPHQLETVDVRGQGVCRQPGIPGEIASQIHENAERARLLTAAYPFYYQREERIASRVDTATYDSRKHPGYRVGHLVRATRDRQGHRELVFLLPTLQDLADSGFQRVHCFWYAGRDGDAIRIDVEPLVTLGDPDIAARFYLDPERYLVRRATFRVTHPEGINPQLQSQVVETRYRELAPLVAVPDSIVSTMTIRERLHTETLVEHDRLIEVWDVSGIAMDTSVVQDVTDTAAPVGTTRDIHGRLVSADGVPLPGAHVEILGLQLVDVTGDSGQFELSGIPSAEQTLFARRIGYRPTTVTLPAGSQTRRITIKLPASSVVTLDPIVVQAAAYQRIGFEERRRTQRGFFLDGTQITRMGAGRLNELLRRAPGLRYVRGGPAGAGGYIPEDSIAVEGEQNCLGQGCRACLSYYADGKLLIDGSNFEPSVMVFRDIEHDYPPDKIAAMEVYAPNEAPAAVTGHPDDCETVVIWTKRYLGLD